jgi:uncharacterized protein (TIGR02217 family)
MASNFFECEFPRTIGYKAMGGPGFNTTVNEGMSGYEQRNQNWSTSRGKWTVNLTTPSGEFITSPKEYVEQLNAFFLVVAGKARGFRLYDHKDFTNGIYPQSLGVGDGVTAQFQLTKLYAVGNSGYLRKIWKPITSLVVDYQGNSLEDSVEVYANTVKLSHGVGYVAGGSEKYTVDETQGIVDFNAYQNFALTGTVKNSDGTVTISYSGVTGAQTIPTKNAILACNGISGWNSDNNGSYPIVSATASTITVYNPTGSSRAGTATGIISKSNIVITQVDNSNGRVHYNTGTSTGQAPAVGMRVTITGMTNSANNATVYVTGTSGGPGTFDTTGAGIFVNETHAGVGYSDWVPNTGVVLTDTFKYHYPVRFDTDELQIQVEDSNTLGEAPIVTWQSIVLRELRLVSASQG